MSAEVSIALRAEQDLTLQYRWYLENADSDVAAPNLPRVSTAAWRPCSDSASR
jgi:hypothetical protein